MSIALQMKHTPHDTDYPFTNANIEFHSATGVQSKISGKPNPNGCWYEAPALPKGISENDNRLTVALDVSFWNGYLDKGHFVLGVRHKKANYEAPGDNRCGAIIVGNWGSGHQRAAAIEEPEINKIADNTFKNKLHHEVSNVIQENRRYRLIIDSIVNNGYVAYEARIKDHSTGQIVYQSPGIIFSSFTHNYDLSARGIIVATIPGNQHDPNPGAGSYSNLTSYWTEDVIAIPNP